jgi:hypothetical protein
MTFALMEFMTFMIGFGLFGVIWMLRHPLGWLTWNRILVGSSICAAFCTVALNLLLAAIGYAIALLMVLTVIVLMGWGTIKLVKKTPA